MKHWQLPRWLGLTLMLMAAVLSGRARADAVAADPTRAAIDAILAEAASEGCSDRTDSLHRILCDRVLRVGVRNNYPGFGVQEGVLFRGFDIDVATRIAQRLNARMEPVVVTPANRIASLADDSVDAVIATMGHSMTRDSQINFVRPHYFASSTAVVGLRALPVPKADALAGRTVCVPQGSASNTMLAEQGARLMIFDQPRHLLDALLFNRCSLVAHDDIFFTESMLDSAFAARFEQKLTLAPLPWGIGLSRRSTSRTRRLLALLITDFHRSGVLIDIAHHNQTADAFLIQQQARWLDPQCILSSGDPAPDCLLEPIRDIEEPTEMTPYVVAVETWLHQRFDVTVTFPMLKGRDSLALFKQGIVNTLILVAGAICATLLFAHLIQIGLRDPRWWVSLPVRWSTRLLQSSPIVLLFILGYFIVTAVLSYSPVVALCTSIVVIGLPNGAFAGSAMSDAARTLVIETGSTQPPLSAIIRRSATQITSFVVNAARASAGASFIGTPELLNVLTDIASVTTERRTTYGILLVVYVSIVMIVVFVSGIVARRIGAREAIA